MPLLSKPLSDEQKEKAYRGMLQLGVLGVLTQNSVLLAETETITNAAGGDPAKAAAGMALSSSISGLIELFLNPVLGKMVDEYGRKPLYYLGPLLSGVGMNALVLLNGGKSYTLMVASRALNWSFISISNSFIGPIAMSDMFSGQELGIRVAKFFGVFGLPVIFAPTVGNIITRRTGSPVNVFKLRLLLGLMQLAHVHFNVPETLTEDRKRKFDISAVNPFAFLKLFSSSSSKTLRTLVTILFASMMAEGKNLIPLSQTWMTSQPLYWSTEQKTLNVMVYGILMVSSGMVFAPRLIKKLGSRGFTSFTTSLNAVAFMVQNSPFPSFDVSYWTGLLLHGIGINNTNASTIKAAATDHAVANGYGRGEYGGMASSLRSMALIVSPLLTSAAYRPHKGSNKVPPGFPYVVMAFIAAILPEMLHRTLSDKDLELPKPEEAPAEATKKA